MNTISELLRKSFEEHGDKPAIIDHGILTYRRLAHDAACLAGALEKSGVRTGDMVGIMLPRSKEYIVAVVACLVYGYGAVLLDMEYPRPRIDYILRDSSANAVIDGTFYKKAMEEDAPAAARPVPPDTGALVVYTSGSTGNPKGVLHDQESVHNAILRFMHLVDYRETDLCGSNFPYTFISIGADVLFPLCLGATVDVVPRDVVRNAAELSQYIDSHQITATVMPPKILRVFKKTGSSLRVVLTGSERVSGIAPEQFRIFNIYGMSEAFPSVCIFELDKAYDCTPIGHGDGSLGIYLLDEDGREADEGEICITGHIFTGYLNLKEQTEKVLVPNPFKDRDGHDTLFHTNDIAKRLPDGNLMYMNRKDWMVKINGFRVEPGEIEYAVRSLERIFDCLVKAFIRKNGTPYLAAYYVEKEPVTIDAIRQFLMQRFPYYMVPAYYVRLEALPVNQNGKLDHKALTAPEQADVSAGYAAPENELEAALCREMAGILCVKKVGRKDDFFSLGGSYEDALYLTEQFADEGLTEKLVYKYKTPEKIAAALMTPQQQMIAGENALALSVPQPITAAQEYYLDYQFYAPEEKMVNNSSVISVPVANIESGALMKLLMSAFSKHPVLSSKIEFDEEGELVLKYFEGELAAIECFHCSEEEYQNSIADRWMRPLPGFDSLLYYCLIYTTEMYHHILFDIHRSICDSQGILNLMNCIRMESEGLTPPADYYYVYLSRTDEAKKVSLDIDTIREIQDFLKDDTFARVPAMDAACMVAMKKGLFCFPSLRSAGDYEMAMKAHQTPVEQLLITAALLATMRYNSSDKAAVSWLFHGREEPWEKAAMGQMTSAIPVGVTLSDYASLIGLLTAVKKQCNACIEYADALSFLGSAPGVRDMLQVEYIDVDRNTLSSPETDGILAEIDVNNRNSGQFHLFAIRKGAEEPVSFRIQYNSACYETESIERFAELFGKAFDLCCFGTLKAWQEEEPVCAEGSAIR